MGKEACIELCRGCPLRERLPDGKTDPDKVRYLENVGQKVVPYVNASIESDGSVSLEAHSNPGRKIVEIAILSEGVETGPAFWVNEHTWENGRVQESFGACPKPGVTKKGFLGLRKNTYCYALSTINR